MNNLCPKIVWGPFDSVDGIHLCQVEFWRHKNVSQSHFNKVRSMAKAIWKDINETSPVELFHWSQGAEIFVLSQQVAKQIEDADIIRCNKLNVLARMCEHQWFRDLCLEYIKDWDCFISI